MTISNRAAWLAAPESYPMEIGPAEYPTAGEGEVVVKTAAIAINPADWFIQIMGTKLFSFLQYPYCGGNDVAGTAVAIGHGVTRFKSGDRVFGVAPGFAAREGAFQEYVVLKEHSMALVPDDVETTQAAVLGLGICTAAAALFSKGHLALDYPTLQPKAADKTLLIWAGASSVGTNAIQLAVASGYEVFTTASPRNFDYCKKLGANQVFDYKSPTVTEEIVAAFEGRTCAGALAIQRGSEVNCFDVVLRTKGSKFVACTIPGVVPNAVPAGVEAAFVQAGTVPGSEVGKYIWEEFLPTALANKQYQCLPPPHVVGHGLEKLQDAIDIGKTGGNSAQKLVVTLD